MSERLQPEKDMKSMLHHWWPRSLSRFWADQDGGVHRLSCDGDVSRAKPSNFGGVTNAHHVRVAETPSVWDQTFEPRFGDADSNFPALVEWLKSLSSVENPKSLPLEARVLPQHLTDEEFSRCIKCMISLVVRSPRFRNSIRQTTEYYRQQFGMKDFEASNGLIALNQRDCQKLFVDAIAGRGKLSVLVSKDTEFIFGDGFFHNFTSSSGAPAHPRMLVPITPQISLYYARPLSYPTEPRLTTVALQREEANFLNDIIQIYSKNEIFYRSQKPTLHDAFKEQAFLEFEYNTDPALEYLEKVVTQTTFY